MQYEIGQYSSAHDQGIQTVYKGWTLPGGHDSDSFFEASEGQTTGDRFRHFYELGSAVNGLGLY